jgi:hypothetical protein
MWFALLLLSWSLEIVVGGSSIPSGPSRDGAITARLCQGQVIAYSTAMMLSLTSSAIPIH